MQLREVVDAVTEDGPPLTHSVDEIISAGRRAERRRRAGFASAGAAGLVVVAMAGSFALTSITSTTSGRSSAAGQNANATWPEAPPFTFTFTAFDAGKFRVADPIVASTAYQIAPVYQTDRITTELQPTSQEQKELFEKLPDGVTRNTTGAHHAYLTLYRPGAFNPAGLTGGTPLTVAGRQAISTSATNPPNRQLAWEYADDAWAVLTAFAYSADPSIQDMSVLVTALAPSPVVPARLPFQVGYLPSGYTPVEIGSGTYPGLNGIAAAEDGNYGGATYANPAPATTGLVRPYGDDEGLPVPSSFTIYVGPSATSNQAAQAGETRCYPHAQTPFCNVWSADGAVVVQVLSTGQLSAAEMTRIAESIEVLDVHDKSAWLPASEALAAR
ncbi:hypothetical protein AB0M35_09090 [Micromonospora sp. NPDC051196]|uniref:hypothetical protein n=1 Tax=Micromonospora sp. NPDC051196 TaxID=3155281 RepID=UPI003425D0D8